MFLGVHLKSTKDLPDVIEKLKTFPEVTEAYFTTGNYALLVKVNTKNISGVSVKSPILSLLTENR